MLEKIPFVHRGSVYQILIEEDISFERLHALLDELNSRGAFADPDECTLKYTLTLEDVTYIVGVDGMNVLVAFG